jgi:Zn-dependent peptidase ImmA (M78 family)
MRRGFKAEAERLAAQAREQLALDPLSGIDPWAYAKALGIVVLSFDQLNLLEAHKRQLLQVDPDSWSGLTLKDESGDAFVLLNPVHQRPRQCSTLMHEVSHVKLKHVPGQVHLATSGLMLLSDYPDDQEQEADWLAAAILLPRNILHHHRSMGWDVAKICAHFGLSREICEWRLRMTGIDRQMPRRQA